MSNSPIRFGFIGAGAISHWSASKLTEHPSGQLTAVQDVDPARCVELCSAFPGARAVSDADEIFKDPEIDVVYIAVPNKFHVPLTIRALEAGKHVLLEKPFAMSAEEAGLAVEAARRAQRVLTLGMNRRFLAESQRFRTLAKEGAFGEIYHAKAYWLRRAGIPKLGSWFGSKELAGGGCLYDIGVHVLDLCLYVMDNFEPASAFGSTYGKFGHRGLGGGNWGKSDNQGLPFDVEDFATGQIRMTNGATISLDVTWARHTESDDLVDVELFGTEAGGQVIGDKIFRYDDKFRNYYTLERPNAMMEHPHGDRFHNLINHLHGKEALCVTLEQALTVQRILDALAESSRTGESVSLIKQ